RGFNKLVLAAGLDWRQVSMLRAYARYLQQVGVPFSQSYVEATFKRHPLVARLLVEMFEARFNPAIGKQGKAEIAAGVERLTAQLQALSGDPQTMALLQPLIDARSTGRNTQYDESRRALGTVLERVSSLDEDRILRSFIGV